MTLTNSPTGSSMHVPIADQARLVIVGTTGMVGGYALRHALEHPAVATVTAIGRKKLGISHPKLKEVLHRDFADCSALAEALSDQDAAIFCLGTYTGAVSDADLRTITVDYTIEFARVLRASSADASFSFLSGNGARTRVDEVGFHSHATRERPRTHSSRPGSPTFTSSDPAYIYPVEPRKEPNLTYRLLRMLYPVFRGLFPNQVIRADDLARAMVDVAVRKTGERQTLVLENRDIRAMVKSHNVPMGYPHASV
jgi:hypothetical protein